MREEREDDSEPHSRVPIGSVSSRAPLRGGGRCQDMARSRAAAEDGGFTFIRL